MVTVREECRAKRQGVPCLKTYEADMVTVAATFDCVGWCPILNRPLDREPEREAAE